MFLTSLHMHHTVVVLLQQQVQLVILAFLLVGELYLIMLGPILVEHQQQQQALHQEMLHLIHQAVIQFK